MTDVKKGTSKLDKKQLKSKLSYLKVGSSILFDTDSLDQRRATPSLYTGRGYLDINPTVWEVITVKDVMSGLSKWSEKTYSLSGGKGDFPCLDHKFSYGDPPALKKGTVGILIQIPETNRKWLTDRVGKRALLIATPQHGPLFLLLKYVDLFHNLNYNKRKGCWILSSRF
jgi:hypothetical protein